MYGAQSTKPIGTSYRGIERKNGGRDARMTLHSNKLISSRPYPPIYRKKKARNADDWATFVQGTREKGGRTPLTAVLISFRYPGLAKVFPLLIY